jgi:competence protein ComEC
MLIKIRKLVSLPRLRPQVKRVVAIALLGLCAHAMPAFSLECVRPGVAVTTGAALRAAPNQAGTSLGLLPVGKTAPLIASVPRWYETRTASGAVAFVSKQSTDIVPCPGAPTPFSSSAGGFEVHAIDVGTGLAVFVRGQGFALLYDAGTNDDLARGGGNRVIAYLKALDPQLRRIDHLILSHPHRDHVELMPDVLAQYDVGNVWNSGAFNNICGYRHFLEAVATEPSVKYHTATQDTGSEPVELGKKKCYTVQEPKHTISLPHQARIDDTAQSLGAGAKMTFLHADGSKRSSYNENSLVVRLDLGPHKVLFMGDAEAGGRKSPTETPAASSIEGKLLACCLSELKADVLIAGHHGSMTSSRAKFLDAVGAKVYVVSSGPTKYAQVTLPDEPVISQFEARGTVLRTDLDDDACAAAEDKIGPDADGKAGGCDNILITLPASGAITGEYSQVAE